MILFVRVLIPLFVPLEPQKPKQISIFHTIQIYISYL